MSELIYGRSALFRRFMEQVDRYARQPWPVLLLGETGVGKELLAERIHRLSPFRSAPWVPVNCAALPGTLVESELFGYVRGAFSGAQTSQPGLFRQADGGTVFLDEIGEMDLAPQAKLLRLLDSGEVRPVGSPRPVRVNVRVVAATNVDLNRAVREGRFRADLRERLSVLPLRVPSLRERREDIPLIAGDLARRFGFTVCPEAYPLLSAQAWPGNVRQLRNFLLRASVAGEGAVSREVVGDLLALEVRQNQPEPAPWEGTLAEIEKRVIVDRLRRCRGNRRQTARELGIAKSTLHEKLRRWREDAGLGMGTDAGLSVVALGG